MKFGTDGFRGPTDTKITPDFCLNLGFHTGCIIKGRGYDSVIIGKDTRVSGYMLESALQAGFISAGIDVKLAGPIPTPAVSFLTATYAGQFGVVISASHNPFEDNGIKFFNRHGRKITEELEREIEARLATPLRTRKASGIGKAFRIDSAAGRYIEYCKSTLKGQTSLKDKTILVDAANGANYKITPMLLTELGAKVIKLNCNPDGFNINEDCAVLKSELFEKYAKDYDFDYCVAVDGDGDRLVLSDSTGNVFNGDDIIYTLASRNKTLGKDMSDSVVGTIMTNQGIDEALAKIDVGLIRTNVGDKHVSRELVKENLNVGGETSGHVIQREFSESGDANIALIQTLTAFSDLDATMTDIQKKINYWPHKLQSYDIKNETLLSSNEFNQKIDDLQKSNTDARISVRQSGTEAKLRVMVESLDKSKVDSLFTEIENIIS